MEEEVDDEVTCPLCFNLFFYPVTLPCKHRFCKKCLDKHVEVNSFMCPMCRSRLSNWLRKIRNSKLRLVDYEFWEEIKKKYPELVEKRRNSDDDSQLLPVTRTGGALNYTLNLKIIDDSQKLEMKKYHEESRGILERNFREDTDWKGWSTPVSTLCRDVLQGVLHQATDFFQTGKYVPHRSLAKPGEIRQEYEEFMRKQDKEMKRQEEINLRLSEDLIRMIEADQKKEEEERERQLRVDETLARSMVDEQLPAQGQRPFDPATSTVTSPQTIGSKERQQQMTLEELLSRKQSPIDPVALTLAEPLKAPITPKRRKQRKLKFLETSETDSIVLISSSTTDDDSGFTDATNSSPFKNSSEMQRSFLGDDPGPIFMGPCSPPAFCDTTITLSSPLSSPTHETSLVPLQCSSPLPGPSVQINDMSPIRLEQPSTSRDDPFLRHFDRLLEDHRANSCPVSPGRSALPTTIHHPASVEIPTSSLFSTNKLSHFAPVSTAPSTSTTVSGARAGCSSEQQPMSRCSSGADSIGQELRHFKPIRTSPTTPPKEGGSWLPQVVVPQKPGLVGTEQQASCSTLALDLGLDILAGGDLSPQDLEESLLYENQLEADRKLAMELEKKWRNEDRKRRMPERLIGNYNLRKRKKGNLRKKVLIDRAQATLDSLLIK